MFQLRSVKRGGGTSASNANLPIFPIVGDGGLENEFLNGFGDVLPGVAVNYDPLEPPVGTGDDGDSEKEYILKKLLSMDQRLVIVERFLDANFCETFQDFSLRSSFYENESRRRRAGGGAGRRGSRDRKRRSSRNHRRSHKRPRHSDESSDDGGSSSGGGDHRHQNRTGTSMGRRYEGYTNGAKKDGTKQRNVMQRRESGNGHSHDYLQTQSGGQPKQPRSMNLIQFQRGQGQAEGQGQRQVQQSNARPSTFQTQTASIVAIPLPAPAPPQPLPVNLNQSTSATSSISSLDFNSKQTSNKTTDNDVIAIPDLNLLRKGKNARGQGQPEMPSISTSTSTSLTLVPEYYNSSSSCNNSDLNVHLNTTIDNMTTGTSKSRVPAPPPSQRSTLLISDINLSLNQVPAPPPSQCSTPLISDINLSLNQVTVVSSPPVPPPGESEYGTIPVPPGDVDVTVQENESTTGIKFGSGEQNLLAGSEVNMNILEGQASEPDVNVDHALTIADAMQMQDFQSEPLDPGQDHCQGQSQEGHHENTDFHPQQQSSMLLMTSMTTPTTSSGNSATKLDSQTQNSRNEDSLVDNDHHVHVPESILPAPATSSPPPSPTKNPLQDSEDDDDDDPGNQSQNATVGSTNTSTSTTTTCGSQAAEMPSDEYLKQIGYGRRLHICPYCKNPCKTTNRFRHLRNHCQVTMAQLRFEESKKGSVEHWSKATLADYKNFYKDENISIEKVATTATVEVEVAKRKSSVKLSQGHTSVKTETKIKNAAVKVPVSKGRGRPKGSFKMFSCSYCGKKMHRIAFKEHEKKCGNNESGTVDDDDSDEEYDVEEDMKPVTSGKRTTSSSVSTSRNSVAASTSSREKKGQCDRCLMPMLARSIPRHKRDACTGKDGGGSSDSSSKVKGQTESPLKKDKPEDEEEEDGDNEDDDDDDEETQKLNSDIQNEDRLEADATATEDPPFDPASHACTFEDCDFIPETNPLDDTLPCVSVSDDGNALN